MGSRNMKMQVERLTRERERLRTEIEALKNQLAGLDRAIELIKQESDSATLHTGRKRPSVKSMTLMVINECGKDGVTAHEIVEMARAKGHDLERASVSSLLSRLKREGTLVFYDSRYYPTEQAPQQKLETTEGGERTSPNVTKNPFRDIAARRVVNLGAKPPRL